MPWPLMVLDWSRHQLPRPGVRCIYASRRDTVAPRNTVGFKNTVAFGDVVVTSDGGMLLVAPIRRETSKACTRLT